MNSVSEKVVKQMQELRSCGESIKVIARTVGVSTGTAHKYLKDITLPDELKDNLCKRGGVASGLVRTESTKDEREKNRNIIRADNIRTSLYTPCLVGDVSTCYIMAAFIEGGKSVSVPFHQTSKYDLIVDDGELCKVQCKTAQMHKRGVFTFSTKSSNGNSKKRKDRSYINKADVFAVYLRETKQVYIFKVENCAAGCCVVRVGAATKQNKKVAAEHLYLPNKSIWEYD